jgi:hypothetical protein
MLVDRSSYGGDDESGYLSVLNPKINKGQDSFPYRVRRLKEDNTYGGVGDHEKETEKGELESEKAR